MKLFNFSEKLKLTLKEDFQNRAKKALNLNHVEMALNEKSFQKLKIFWHFFWLYDNLATVQIWGKSNKFP